MFLPNPFLGGFKLWRWAEEEETTHAVTPPGWGCWLGSRAEACCRWPDVYPVLDLCLVPVLTPAGQPDPKASNLENLITISVTKPGLASLLSYSLFPQGLFPSPHHVPRCSIPWPVCWLVATACFCFLCVLVSTYSPRKHWLSVVSSYHSPACPVAHQWSRAGIICTQSVTTSLGSVLV